MTKCRCGKAFDEGSSPYGAFDILRGSNEVKFCSKECMRSWAYGKIFGMAVSLVIGVVLGIALCFEMGITGIFLIFVPYMLRRIFGGLGGGTSSTGGEVVVFIATLLGSVTLVYPIYKIIQEIREYAYVIRQSKAD